MAQTKRNGSKKKNSASSRSKAKDAEAIRLEKEKSLNRKITVSVVLGAFSLLILAILFIRGESLWDGMRSFVLGFFGWLDALMIPVALIYIAALCIKDEPKQHIKKTAWLTAAFLIMLSTLIFVFTYDIASSGYWEILGDLYIDAKDSFNSGLLGGLLGVPFVLILGEIGARVVIVLATLVLFCLTIGISIYRSVMKKHEAKRRLVEKDVSLSSIDKKSIESFAAVTTVNGEAMENRGQRRRKRNIDIPVDVEDTESDTKEQDIVVPIINGKSVKEPKGRRHSDKPVPARRAYFDIPLDNEPNEDDYARAEGRINREIILDNTNDDTSGFSTIIPQMNGTALNDALTRPRQSNASRSDNADTQSTLRDSAESANNEQTAVQTTVYEEAARERQGSASDIDRLIDQVTLEQIDNKPKKQPIEVGLDHEPDLTVKKQVFIKPPITMYKQAEEVSQEDIQEELRQNAEKLVEVLRSFGIETRIVGISRGPSVTRYELQPAAGVKISRITSLADDLALGLAAISIRIEAPIPGRSAIGIEIPNHVRSGVSLREVLESDQFRKAKSKITVALGRDITGKVVVTDLAKMPHLLIAGTTGSGKSVTVQCMIQSVLYNASPDEVKILLIDPKRVEFKAYNGIPNLLVPVVTEPRKAAGALGWAVTEMLKRYNIFADHNVRDIYDYNELAAESEEIEPMPQILIIVDEFSDLMMAAKSEVEDYVCRLAQMARAAGMHLVIATQRPSTDVITGLIKANIPSRLALSVSNNTDSRVILDSGGAEKLLGNGDMLFSPIGASKPTRIQGCYVSIKEINDVTDFLRRQQDAEYDESVMEEIEKQSISDPNQGMDLGEDADELLPQAIEIVLDVGEASATLLQRRLRLGYARAGRLVDTMEKMGIVGPHEGSKPRKVLIGRQEWIQMKMGEAEEQPF